MLKAGVLIVIAALAASPSIPKAAPSQPPVPSAGEPQGNQQTKPQSGPERPTPDQRGTQNVPLIVNVVSTPERDKEAAAKADYAKQEAANNWWLVIITAVLATFAFFQWCAMTWQAVLTRQALSDSNRQHAVSNRAFAYLKQLAYFPLVDSHGTTTAWQIMPMWHNSGNTPTKNGLVSINWEKRAGDLPTDFNYPYADTGNIVFVGPQAEVGSGVVEVPNTTLNYAAQFQERIYIWGIIQYKDVFPESQAHFTRFCGYLDFRDTGGQRSIAFVQHGPHNGADNDDRIMKWPRSVLDGVLASALDIHKKS